MNRTDWLVRFLFGIMIGALILVLGLAAYESVNNAMVMSKIINGYVIDKDYRADYYTHNRQYNGTAYYTTTIHHPASYTFVIQSDKDADLTARYSVSAGKYELYDIGDYIENVNKTLGYHY